MKLVNSIRIYHLVLAVLALLAYFSDDLRHIHAWLGYAVSALLVFRLLWSLKDEPQLKLSCLIPCFKGIQLTNVLKHPAISKTITLGVYLSLIGAAITGIALDKGRTLGLTERPAIQHEAAAEPSGQHRERHRHQKPAMAEAHEFFANIFLIFALLHIAHMVAYRRPMALHMFFLKR